jgi:hypothetical protein
MNYRLSSVLIDRINPRYTGECNERQYCLFNEFLRNNNMSWEKNCYPTNPDTALVMSPEVRGIMRDGGSSSWLSVPLPHCYYPILGMDYSRHHSRGSSKLEHIVLGHSRGAG